MTDFHNIKSLAKPKAREDYFLSNMSPLHPCQEKLIQLTKNVPDSVMISSPESITVLSNMIRFAGGKRCIDVGVFTGYSSLSWALSIPDDGKVVACDISSEFPEVGKPVWKEAGVDSKIDLRIGDAAQSLEAMVAAGESGSYDFMYIDADKPGYDKYYELGLKLIRKNGLIAIDNTWWGGNLLDSADTNPNNVAIRELNQKIKSDDRVTAVLLDSGDGVYVCTKN